MVMLKCDVVKDNSCALTDSLIDAYLSKFFFKVMYINEVIDFSLHKVRPTRPKPFTSNVVDLSTKKFHGIDNVLRYTTISTKDTWIQITTPWSDFNNI